MDNKLSKLPPEVFEVSLTAFIDRHNCSLHLMNFSGTDIGLSSFMDRLLPFNYLSNFLYSFFILQCLVQALYDFAPQEPGELEFRRGDVITVTDRTDQHWWHGEIGNRRGLFPSTYVTQYHS